MSLNLGGYAVTKIQQVQQQQLNIGGYAVVRVGKIPTKLTLEVRPL